MAYRPAVMVGATKSGRVRSLKLAPSAITSLRECKIRQREELGRLGFWPTLDTSIVTNSLGRAMAPRTLGEAFSRFTKRHGFALTFHGLRHSATILRALSGVDVVTIAGELGHATPNLIFTTYGHYLRSASETSAQRVEDALTAH